MFMKNIVNYRPVVVYTLILILGIFIGYYSSYNAWYAFFVMLPMAIIICCAIKFIDYNILYYLIALIIGFVSTFISIKTFNTNIASGSYQVYGTVSEIVSLTDYGKQTELSNVSIVTDTKTSIPGKAILYFDNDVDINIGDKIYFWGKVIPTSIIENSSINTYVYKYNYKYKINVTSDIQIEDTSKGLVEIIKLKSYQRMSNIMSEEVAGISYAVLFGDRALVDDNVYSVFGDTGTAHILAVSGLHVGFLIAILLFLLSLCKVKGWYQFFTIFVVLIIYCYICDFSPSVLRASIMGLVLLFAQNTGRQQDMFSSLALSAILILTFRPLYIFDTGFLMSYGAVLGIMFLYRPLTKLLGGNSWGKYFVGALSVSLCAQLGIVPILISFGSLSIYSTIANVVVVPLFGIYYSLLCIFNLIILILPFMAFLYYIVEALMQVIITVANFVAGIPGNLINIVYIGFLSIVLYYLAIFVGSRFVMANVITKSIIIAMIGVVAIVAYLIKLIPYNYIENCIEYVPTQQPYTLVKTVDNYNILINFPTNQSEYDDLLKETAKNNIKINTVLILPDNNFSVNNLINFCINRDIKVIIPYDHIGIEFVKDVIKYESISNDNRYTLGNNFCFRYLYKNGQSTGCIINIKDLQISYIQEIDDEIMYAYDKILTKSDYVITNYIDDIYKIFFEKSKISCYDSNFSFKIQLG